MAEGACVAGVVHGRGTCMGACVDVGGGVGGMHGQRGAWQKLMHAWWGEQDMVCMADTTRYGQ